MSTSAQLPSASADSATRLLCGAVYLDDGFADMTRTLLIGDGLTAAAPPAGVHLPSLLQHALHARRVNSMRNAALSAILPMSLLCGVPILADLNTNEIGPAVILSLIGLVSVATAAWTIASAALWTQLHTAAAVARGSASVLSSVPPLPPDLNSDMYAAQHSDVVCYNGDLPSPFQLFGVRMEAQVNVSLPIAVATKRADDDADKPPRETAELDIVALHRYLERKLTGIGVDGISVRSKLFVRGDAVNGIAALFPAGRDQRPSPIAGPLIYVGLTNPGDRAHTFLEAETVRHGGQLVVTFHVRLRHAHGRLSLETSARMMPPVATAFKKVGPLPREIPALRSMARWQALNVLPKLVAFAPWRVLQRSMNDRKVVRGRLKTLRAIRAQRPPDRGARSSVRDFTSDVTQMKYQEFADSLDIIQRLRQGLYDAVYMFLEDHGLETADFAKLRDAVVKVETTNFYGDITADAFASGAGAHAHVAK